MNSRILFRLARLLPFMLLLHTGVTNARTDVQVSDQLLPIGQVDFPVSCSAKTRDSLEGAVMMLHHMMYAQAERSSGQLLPVNPIAPWHTGVSP